MKLDNHRGILIRCEGTPELGLGHVVRCGALGAELQARGGTVRYLCQSETVGARYLREQGGSVIGVNEWPRLSYREWLAHHLKQTNSDAIIYDVRDELSRSDLEWVRGQTGVVQCVLDDASDRRLAADLCFYPPVPQFHELNWDDAFGTVYAGWEWVILRSAFSKTRRAIGRSERRVLIMMGGTDPKGLTKLACEAFRQVREPCRIHLVMGSGFVHRDAVTGWVENLGHAVTLHENVREMASLMSKVDCAIIGFGISAYELAAVGVPGIYLCLTQDHARSAQLFHDSGLGCSLGAVDTFEPRRLLEEIQKHLAPKDTMEEGGLVPPLVDGLGSARIADLIQTFILSRRRRSES